LQAQEIDKVVLVGGATRTPLVHRLLQERLGRPVHAEIEPDLAVALGAAVQGALIAGMDVGPVLVDITPHTLGIEALGELHGFRSVHCFARIIERNTPLPASRTEMFATSSDGQKVADIRVFQGEDDDTRHNTLVGQFTIEGLADVHAGNQIVVKLDLDLSGILKVTATERITGLARQVTIDNATERFRKTQRTDALDRIEAAFQSAEGWSDEESGFDGDIDVTPPGDDEGVSPVLREAAEKARALIAKAERLLPDANTEDAGELTALLADLNSALAGHSIEDIRRVAAEVEDLVFYLEDV
jgi:molecular chaperone DnaK